MTIQLTPEQERRVLAVIGRGAYKSVNEVVEAALAAVEQRAAPGFDGPEEELEILLEKGLASEEIPEAEFWASVDEKTDAMLTERKSRGRS